MSYKAARGYVPVKGWAPRGPGKTWGRPVVTYGTKPIEHWPTRQGDEMACRCGKRWPVGEDHP